jgi:hypothetical protein
MQIGQVPQLQMLVTNAGHQTFNCTGNIVWKGLSVGIAIPTRSANLLETAQFRHTLLHKLIQSNDFPISYKPSGN